MCQWNFTCQVSKKSTIPDISREAPVLLGVGVGSAPFQADVNDSEIPFELFAQDVR